MHVKRIEIIDLTYAADTGLFEAQFCLNMTDRHTGTATHAILLGHAEKQPHDSHDTLAQNLLADARRQMTRMPEYLLGRKRLTFENDAQILRAA